MHECFGGGDPGFASAEVRNDFMMRSPDAFAVLAAMSNERGLFLFTSRGDVNVSTRSETLGLAAGVDFEKVKLRPARQPHASAIRAHAGDLMIHVRINRPVSKNQIRI